MAVLGGIRNKMFILDCCHPIKVSIDCFYELVLLQEYLVSRLLDRYSKSCYYVKKTFLPINTGVGAETTQLNSVTLQYDLNGYNV